MSINAWGLRPAFPLSRPRLMEEWWHTWAAIYQAATGNFYLRPFVLLLLAFGHAKGKVHPCD